MSGAQSGAIFLASATRAPLIFSKKERKVSTKFSQCHWQKLAKKFKIFFNDTPLTGLFSVSGANALNKSRGKKTTNQTVCRGRELGVYAKISKFHRIALHCNNLILTAYHYKV